MPDPCACPRCRRPEAYTWLGLPLCERHWLAVCDRRERGETAEEIQRTLGLLRTNHAARHVR